MGWSSKVSVYLCVLCGEGISFFNKTKESENTS